MPQTIEDCARDWARAEKDLERAKARLKAAAEAVAAAEIAVADARKAHDAYAADTIRAARAAVGLP